MAPIDPRDFGRFEAEVQAMQRQIYDMTPIKSQLQLVYFMFRAAEL